MTSDVVLSSALRTNLLSLQRTQSLIDETQLRLATGLKVNSALDNPSNFFAAQGLQNRASDLSRLLDGIGQSIQAIRTTDEGIQSLTTLVEQAESLATQAKDATSSAAESAKIIGDVDLTGFVVGTGNSLAANDTIDFTITDQGGNEVAISGGTVTLTGSQTIESIVNEINAIRTTTGNNQVFNASLTSDGRLSLATVSGYNFGISFTDTTSSPTVASSTAIAADLGFGNQVIDQLQASDGSDDSVGFSVKAAAAITTQSLFQTDGTTLATRSTALQGLLRDEDGTGTNNDVAFNVANLDTDGDDTLTINIGLNQGSARQLEVTDSTTIQELVDAINADSVLKTKIEASFNETTGQLSIAALDASTESVEISASLTDVDSATAGNAAAVELTFDLGFGVISAQDDGSTLDVDAANNATATAQTDIESIRLSGGSGDLVQFQTDFNKTLEQIDALVADANYRGTNLLQGDTLETTFNEDGTSTLTTTGADLTSSGLGFTSASFISQSQVDQSISQAQAALDTVRNFSSSIAGDLVIIQTREEFTQNLINNLQEGADNLTLADQNEEGANLLALQTRQTLGVTSLSLASQSQQSVLRLF